MVRYLIPLLLLLSSCASFSVELPRTDARIVAPEDGAIVPDTFSLSIFAHSSGVVFRKEIVYGFPDGPVERGRFPGCYRFEAVVKVNGREVGRYEGCDTLMTKARVRAKGEKVRVELKVGRTVKRATYHVVKPYPYTLIPVSLSRDTVRREAEPPVRYYERVPFEDGELLLSWEDGTTVLYLWSDTVRELLRGRWLKASSMDGLALVVGEDEEGGFYAVVGGEGVVISRRVESPMYVGRSLKCKRGVAYASNVGVVWLDGEGNAGLSGYPRAELIGEGCLNDLPYFSFSYDTLLILVGKDTLTLPVPESVGGTQVFYGHDGKILLLQGDWGGIRVRMWDGEGWVKTYFPWEPLSGRCYGPTMACVCMCPIAFPLVILERGCTVETPMFGVEASGIRVGERLYEVKFFRTSKGTIPHE